MGLPEVSGVRPKQHHAQQSWAHQEPPLQGLCWKQASGSLRDLLYLVLKAAFLHTGGPLAPTSDPAVLGSYCRQGQVMTTPQATWGESEGVWALPLPWK